MGMLRTLFCGLAGLTLTTTAAAHEAFDRDAWLADYAAIKAGMVAHYANLDSRLMSQRINPASLDERVTERLSNARSDLEAYDILRDFVEVFDDPHLAFRFNAPRSAIDTGLVREADPAVAGCEEAGYSDRRKAFAPRMVAIPGWKQIGDDAFPHAIAGELGIIRIASFGENHYASVCKGVFKPGMGERALQLATRAALQEALGRSIGALKAAGARTLLIDVSGNGGGSEWDREAAQLFTDKLLVRSEARIADAQCDRSSIWKGEIACEVFRSEGEQVHLQGLGTWTGRVAILANRGTASAAEEFIGWLVDNKVAVLIGERTMGAGCGYMDGGQPVALKSAPITLHMPNCARFTAEGANEVEGWTPERAIDFPREADPAWGQALLRALQT